MVVMVRVKVRRDKNQEKKFMTSHTCFILRLVPTSIASHVLWFLLLLLPTTKHLIEESELSSRRHDEGSQNG
jgi:hypothetical protein